jgi:hypothetical protein
MASRSHLEGALPRTAAPLLVAAALLLCHGALGSLHLLSSGPLPAERAVGHAHHQEGHCLGGAEYPAALLTPLLGGALLLLLLRRAPRPRPQTPAVPPDAPHLPVRSRVPLPRGPTLPLLQVFLL